MTRRELVLFILLALLLVGVWLFMRHKDQVVDHKAADTTLAPGVVDKLIVDPDKHTLIVVTSSKEEHLFLPDRPSSIEINKNGQVTVTSKQYGTEIKPFGGVGYSDSFRLYGGVDLAYWKKLDGGLFGSASLKYPVRLGPCFSYTVYDNTRLTLGIDNAKDINGFVSWRF